MNCNESQLHLFIVFEWVWIVITARLHYVTVFELITKKNGGYICDTTLYSGIPSAACAARELQCWTKFRSHCLMFTQRRGFELAMCRSVDRPHALVCPYFNSTCTLSCLRMQICRNVYIYAVRLGSGPIFWGPLTHHKTSDSVEIQEKWISGKWESKKKWEKSSSLFSKMGRMRTNSDEVKRTKPLVFRNLIFCADGFGWIFSCSPNSFGILRNSQKNKGQI